jgi:hypothetical protein
MEDVITNTTNLTPSNVTYKSILSTPTFNPTPSSSVEASTKSGFFSGNLFRYLLIILILSFLGFNLFSYLANVNQFFAKLFRPIFMTLSKIFGISIGETTKVVTGVTAAGIKTGVDVTAGTIITSANVLEKTLIGGYSKNNIDSSLDTALYNEKKQTQSDPMPDEAGSGTQANKSSKKSGFCYIGEDRGFRSCLKVNDSDECLSGDIFPTREICINPNLRE